MTKDEIVTQLKQENPTLFYGINDEVIEMTAEEYEATIQSWADIWLARETKAQAKAEAEAQRQALLAKLGITEDEARLLLGGN